MAQQQCVGPLQLPISNVAVMAQSHFGLTGAATAIGEQPLKGLINPAAMARLCLGEALTNLVWAQSTGMADIKASVNWMYAAKMASEGVAMYEAATALKEAMIELQVRVVDLRWPCAAHLNCTVLAVWNVIHGTHGTGLEGLQSASQHQAFSRLMWCAAIIASLCSAAANCPPPAVAFSYLHAKHEPFSS